MARLCRAPDRRIRVLTGLGGSGKTTMVLAVAEQVASDGVRVWWLTVRSRQALTADLLDLLVDLPALHSLAAGLRRDLDAVVAGLTMPWSSGPVEGNVNRIETIERQMYGRAGFSLLRKRILLNA